MPTSPNGDTHGDLESTIAIYDGMRTGLLNTLDNALWPHTQSVISAMEEEESAISILSACGHERDLRWILKDVHHMELIIRDANCQSTQDSLVNAVVRAKTKIEDSKGEQRIIFIWNANIHDSDSWVHILNLISGTTFKICLVVPEDDLVETVRIHSGRILRHDYKPDMANVIQNIVANMSKYNIYIDGLHEASRKAWKQSRNAVDFISEITEEINYHMWDNPVLPDHWEQLTTNDGGLGGLIACADAIGDIIQKLTAFEDTWYPRIYCTEAIITFLRSQQCAEATSHAVLNTVQNHIKDNAKLKTCMQAKAPSENLVEIRRHLEVFCSTVHIQEALFHLATALEKLLSCKPFPIQLTIPNEDEQQDH